MNCIARFLLIYRNFILTCIGFFYHSANLLQAQP